MSYGQAALGPFMEKKVRLNYCIGGIRGHWSGPYWIVTPGVSGFYYKACPVASTDCEPKYMHYGKLQGIEVMK